MNETSETKKEIETELNVEETTKLVHSTENEKFTRKEKLDIVLKLLPVLTILSTLIIFTCTRRAEKDKEKNQIQYEVYAHFHYLASATVGSDDYYKKKKEIELNIYP